MVDPSRVTDFARTQAQLEEFLLFCFVVAGKNADQQSVKLEAFLEGRSPFAWIRKLEKTDSLVTELRRVKMGKYSLLSQGFHQVAHANLDLRTCTWETLTTFPGIGIKTAKFFILHSRESQMLAVLDTHVLYWMKECLGHKTPRGLAVPDHTPQDPSLYQFWETVYFGLVLSRLKPTQASGENPINWAHVDLDLWKTRRAL
ncbi:MAG: helix-hairpin-helix domain-containing protein [Verrucomicrobiota bacterium]|jgi:hypothetical protein|nr:MAG: helix-hairpin-helix domain-containing protein [Verrucomicrobiota bacterium]